MECFGRLEPLHFTLDPAWQEVESEGLQHSERANSAVSAGIVCKLLKPIRNRPLELKGSRSRLDRPNQPLQSEVSRRKTAETSLFRKSKPSIVVRIVGPADSGQIALGTIDGIWIRVVLLLPHIWQERTPHSRFWLRNYSGPATPVGRYRLTCASSARTPHADLADTRLRFRRMSPARHDHRCAAGLCLYTNCENHSG
jgi:hypothetical protein